MRNHNQRDQAHATFGNAWRWRITKDPIDTIKRWAEALPQVINRMADTIIRWANQFIAATETSHTAPQLGQETENPGFYDKTEAVDHPALQVSLSLDVEKNTKEGS